MVAGVSTFNGVSCTGIGECTAVGDVSVSGTELPLYVTETGGVWGSPTEMAAGEDGASFYGISCTGIGECTAVGYNFAGIRGGSQSPFPQAIYATETGGVWGSSTVLDSPNGGLLYGVSCTGIGECTGVGNFSSESGHTFYVTETGGVWGPPIEIPGTASNPFAVSCSGVGNCVALGNLSNSDRSSYAVEAGGVWGSVTVFGNSPNNSFLSGVSCTGADAGDCTAVGYDAVGAIYSTTVAAGPPTISSFTPTGGSVGSAVTINGTNLGGATNVTVNGVAAAIAKDAATSIKIKIPSGATTGKIKVFTPGGKAKSATVMMIT